ncbi:MAG: hypothetical protein Q7S48_04300 [bacterium]|nr:hypothetical protein [bacterium]
MSKHNYWILFAIIIIVGILLGVFKVIRSYPRSAPNAQQDYKIPEGFTSYTNRTLKFSLVYPNTWTTKKGPDKYEVAFVSPDNGTAITTELLYLQEGEKLDYHTYVARLLAEDPSIKFDKADEKIKNIQGSDWLIFDGILKVANDLHYVKYGIYITGDHDGQQFFRFLLDSDKNHYTADSIVFDKVLESVRFY